MRNFFESPFFTKLLHWEFWPWYIANIPTVCFWLFFALRSRSLFFFSRVNPVIETGGVLGESKINILNRIPATYLPTTLFVAKEEDNWQELQQRMVAAKLKYPVIAKPNVGERGFLVTKIDTANDLKAYLHKVKVDFLIQEYVDYPLEISVLYYRFPDQPDGRVTSICIKDMLHVTGDGQSTVAELMANYPRAALQLDRFRKVYPDLLQEVPAMDKRCLLEPIGNHSRGTTFLNGNAYIDAELTAVFNRIGQQMKGIHYGRFDMKCSSIAALKTGEAFKILEFNGIASEPAHIYDPSYPVWKAYRDLFQHWQIIFQISQRQAAKGVAPMSWSEAVSSIKTYRRTMRNSTIPPQSSLDVASS